MSPYRKPGKPEEGTGSPIDVGPPTPVTTAPAQEPLLDLGIPGLPPEVAAKVDKILRSGSPTAVEEAMAYIRSTDWYKQTYRGIGAGIQKGLFGDEGGYRGWVNAVQQYFRRYYGRDATADELEQFLNQGFSPETIGKMGEGKAIADAQKPDLQWATGAFDTGQLSPEELQAYGEQQAGLGSTLGIKIQNKVQQALAKAERVFQGSLATSPLGMESLAQTQRRRPDVGA